MTKRSPQHHVCVLIPTYDNPATIRHVAASARAHVDHVIVIDDGSGPEGRAACARLVEEGLAYVHRREKNGGKGAAVRTGFEVAHERGFTHALQIDGDGQHDLAQIPTFLAASSETPDALILGYPEYDASAPTLRQNARKITDFWVNLEVGEGVVRDAMIGFRVYPIAAALAAPVWTRRMGFDIEIIVQMVWRGAAVRNLPIAVRYLSEAEGGVSHFRPILDNVSFSFMHARLTTQRMFTRLLRAFLSFFKREAR